MSEYENKLRGWLREIAIHLGSPDDEDVVKFFLEYRAEFNANWNALAAAEVARAAAAERAEALAGLVSKVRNYWIDHLGTCHAVPGSVCSCGRNALLGDIDELIRAAAQPAATEGEGG